MYIKNKFINGEKIFIKPFQGLNQKIEVCVKIVKHNEIKNNVYFKKIVLKNNIDINLVDKSVKYIKQFNNDHEECWHKKLNDNDSGNIIDKIGFVSDLLDKLRFNLNWENQYPSLDKLIVNKKNHIKLNEFHTDHFNCYPSRLRSNGDAKRVFINLSNNSRWVCIIDYDYKFIKNVIGNNYNIYDYKRLLNEYKNNLILFFIECKRNTHKDYLYGIEIDAFYTIHGSYSKKNQILAVLTNYKNFNKYN